ncbi:MAG: transketolase C-terminal domain-containing protein [Patescibacteria group bacterium]
MINKDAKLSEKIFTDEVEKKPTRDGFGLGTVEAGKKDERVVVLSADLAESTRADWFQKEFPDRFIEMGVAEQNLATVSAGLANYGKIPFFTSYAAFSPGRNYEQIRTTIALNDVPAKVCGMHAGVQTGPDGATHEMLEDIALMRVLPNMIVIVPGDAEEGRKATVEAAFNGKPTYLRFGREKMPVFTSSQTPFEIGKAYYLWEDEKPEVGIIGCGPLLYEALLAAKQLKEEGIAVSVLNSHTVKPLDEKTILDLAKRTGALVTVEEHQIAGGLGSAVAEFLAREHPTPIEFIGMHDEFGQSGTASELIAHYKLNASAIVDAVRRVVSRKQ